MAMTKVSQSTASGEQTAFCLYCGETFRPKNDRVRYCREHRGSEYRNAVMLGKAKSGRANWDAFHEWLEDHRDVYREFKRFAYQLKRAGAKRIGAKMVAERVRWESAIRRTGDYKVDNTYVAYMARKLANEDPAFEELFEFRGTL